MADIRRSNKVDHILKPLIVKNISKLIMANGKRCVDDISSDSLINSIKYKQWDLVRAYVYQANIADEEDRYALHHVCDINRIDVTPMYIVQLVYNAFPDAAYFLDASESTPLFIAVDSNFEEAVDFLAHKNPETVLIPNYPYGLTPLQHALEDREPNNMIDSLLSANPSAVHELNNKNLIIFESFFAERNCSVRIFLEKHLDVSFTNSTLDSGIEADDWTWSAHAVYLKASILLKAATMENSRSGIFMDDSWMILHSSFREYLCPWSFCNFLLRLHPEEAMMTDSNGDLPIHIIAAASKESSDSDTISCDRCGPVHEIVYVQNVNMFEASMRLCPICYRDDAQTRYSGEVIMKPVLKVPRLIQDLLLLNPQMVCFTDRNGKYPLNISISSQQTFDAIKHIFDASPCVGRISDSSNGSIPFKSAAVGDWEDDVDQLNTIFYLLIQDPVVVNY